MQRDIKLMPYKIVDKGGKPYISVKYKGEEKEYAPEEISAMILTKVALLSPLPSPLSPLPSPLSPLCSISASPSFPRLLISLLDEGDSRGTSGEESREGGGHSSGILHGRTAPCNEGRRCNRRIGRSEDHKWYERKMESGR